MIMELIVQQLPECIVNFYSGGYGNPQVCFVFLFKIQVYEFKNSAKFKTSSARCNNGTISFHLSLCDFKKE